MRSTANALTRCSAPFYVQFEITQKCNNRCFFCYNAIGDVPGQELDCREIKHVLTDMAAAGVFRVNFNGGEPLARPDFFEIAQHAYDRGIEIHMNTNATLITDEIARRLAPLMKSVCVSMLASTPERHDEMAGRKGAFREVLAGMDALRKQGVGIEVNVCTTMENYRDLYDIGKVAAQHGCYAFCSTRYILTGRSQAHLLLTPEATATLLGILNRIKGIPGIRDVSLPGPVPFCELPAELFDALAELNVPCQYGYGLCRISATGSVTPCTISSDVIADLRQVSFRDAWNADGWAKYVELKHIPPKCQSCDDLARCRGGCVVYDECLLANGIKPLTRKWGT